MLLSIIALVAAGWLLLRLIDTYEEDGMTCEDYPCCGHELGDCDGSLYGSDEDSHGR